MSELDHLVELTDSKMGRRGLLAGLAGIGLLGTVGVTTALAQDSTPTAAATPDDSTDESDKGEIYQDFVSNLADALGSDATTVDAGIRTALKAMVDDVYADGDISKNAATELKSRIDTSPAPIALVVAVAMGKGGAGRRRRRRRTT